MNSKTGRETRVFILLVSALLALTLFAGCSEEAATGTTGTEEPALDLFLYNDTALAADNIIPSQVYVWTDYGANVSLNGSCASDPYEGANCWEVTDTATGGWNGWGIASVDNDDGTKGFDATDYADGHLRFAIKIPTGSNVTVMMDSIYSGSQNWVNISLAGGFVPDGEWHEVAIPVKAFMGESSRVNYFIAFMQNNANYVADNVYYIDDLRLTAE
jgi:hypothetical protein